jgi:hypothetical protein
VWQAPTTTVRGGAAQLGNDVLSRTLHLSTAAPVSTPPPGSTFAINATLTWPVVSTTNAGHYRVIVTRDCTNRFSAP